MTEVKILTNKLLHTIEELIEIYEAKRQTGVDGDFYLEVKPYVDPFHSLLDEWKEATVKWLKLNPQKHIHILQIKHTCENLELIAVQAFFPKTSYKRFHDYAQSSLFVVEKLKNTLDIETK
jgi:hypothetical protein